MSKFVTTEYSGTSNILKFPGVEFQSWPVTVDDTGVSANAYGKKFVLAGTIVGGASASVIGGLRNRTADHSQSRGR